MHLYVDESKAKGYLVAAAAMLPEDVTAARRALRALLPRRQRRLHMVDEDDALRRKLLATLEELDVQVTLYAAGQEHGTDIRRRRACLGQLVRDAADHGCQRLTLESDRTQDARDRQALIEIVREVGCRDMTYGHMSPYEEPLLWMPDGVAWAYARGGAWREAAMPVITAVIDV